MNTFPDRLCVTRQLELKTVSSASWRDRNRTSNRALCYNSYLKSRLHHSKIFSEMKWDDTLVVYKKQHKPFSFWFCGKWVHKIVPLINVGFTLSPVFYTNGSERNVPLNPSEFFKQNIFSLRPPTTLFLNYFNISESRWVGDSRCIIISNKDSKRAHFSSSVTNIQSVLKVF